MSGDVPEGWEENTLGDLTTVAGGTTPKREVAEYWADGSVCWATPTDITSLPLSSYELTITREKISNLAVSKGGSKVFPPRTVLMTSRATIGYVAIANIPTSTNQGFANFLPNSSYEPQFLCYLLEAKRDEIVQKSGGSTFKEISKSSLKSISILLPPLPEQQRIAEILSSVDESIRATEAVIAQAERVKRGLMEDLLTGGLGSAAIANGDVPEGWTFGKFEDLARIRNGFAFKSSDFTDESNGTVLVLRMSNFNDGDIIFDDCKRVGLEIVSGLGRFQLHDGDIVIAMSGATVGKLGRVRQPKEEIYLNQRVGCVVAKNSMSQDFIWQIMSGSAFRDQVFQSATGNAQPNISGKQIEEITMAVPPIAEQVEIAEILSSVDTQITTNRATVEQLQRLKRGLMDDLLTGKVRTVA